MSPRLRVRRADRTARKAREAERERRRQQRQSYSTAEWDSLPTGEQEQIPPEDDWMRPASRPPPEPRRPRHRDLPARVRRRQDVAVIVLALILIGGAYLLFFRGGGGEGGPGIGPKRLVGQSIVAKMGKDGPDRDLLRRAKRGQIGGVIALERNAKALNADAAKVQQAAAAGDNPPLLVMVDQEGGIVKRLPDGPPTETPANLGVQGADAARSQGEDTGRFLVGAGVNVDLAPVLDLSEPDAPRTIRARTFGSNPNTVGEVGSAFAEGLATGGVEATAKHFPGLGLATQNTDFAAVTIDASAQELQRGIQPFQTAIEAGVPLVMVSTAVYPALGSKDPAALSSSIVTGELRDKLGFGGVIITDELGAESITSTTTSDRAGLLALKAGCDMLLYAGSVQNSKQAFNTILKANQSGAIDSSVLQGAYDRITSLKDSLGAGS